MAKSCFNIVRGSIIVLRLILFYFVLMAVKLYYKSQNEPLMAMPILDSIMPFEDKLSFFEFCAPQTLQISSKALIICTEKGSIIS